MRVTFVELTAFEGILPLASGYMQAYACQDAAVRETCTFDIYTAPVDADREAIANELIARGSDVYALSCYIWNMKLVAWVLERLRAAVPDANFILGGPQVMNHADDYVARDHENVVVCNGEGEVTFYSYLCELLAPRGDFSTVPGLSYMRDGELVTTAPAPRIKELVDIPSPFAAGVFEPGKYSTAILETNRGCPFRCGFCYWGAATNDRVHRFEEERVRSDITWIAQNGFISVFIIDANWGMLPRDIEFTRHIVDCSKQYGYPVMVSMASAKNSPDRVAQITELLVAGGLLTSQPISLQTMNPETLDLIQRSNIKYSAYESLQRQLREKQISSYIELIWPLPGETIESYREGIGSLCRARADTIIVYPQLLLHNTPIYRDRVELGVEVERVPSEFAEADVVVGTNWATREDYEQGIWFYYAVHSVYNLRGLYFLTSYLDSSGRSPFEQTFSEVARWFEAHSDHPICRFFADSVASLWNYDLHNNGLVAHMVLHSHRAEFDELLAGFVRAQPWWSDPTARAAFELDLLARPYIYAEEFRMPAFPFGELEPASAETGVTLPATPAVQAALAAGEISTGSVETGERLLLEHPPTGKLPFMSHRSLEHNASYCQGMVLRLRELLPVVRAASGAQQLVGSAR